MYKLILTVLFVCLSASVSSAIDKSTSVRLLNRIEIRYLSKMYKDKGLDGVVKNFYDVSQEMKKAYKDKPKNSKGLKVLDKNGKKLLNQLVKSAEYITQKMDRGSLHYYGFAKLYKEIPVDLSLAIEQSGLNAEQKTLMRQGLINTLNN